MQDKAASEAPGSRGTSSSGMTDPDSGTGLGFLAGSGRMGEEVRTFDWSSTSLGPPDRWPQSLKTAAGVVLHATSPMALAWGPELYIIHNDAYLPYLGTAFGTGIGQRLPEFRSDIWPVIKPYVDAALRGEGRGAQDREMTTWRNGVAEKANFTFTYSPIYNEGGVPEGVLAYVQETTTEVAIRAAIAAENRHFTSLFEQAPVSLAMFSTDDYRFEYANRAFRELVGGDATGKTIDEALPGLASQGFVDLIKEVERTGRPYIGYDQLFVSDRATGPRQHYLDFIYQPITAPDGNVTAILYVGTDVTERHKAQEEKEKLQKQLLSTSRLNAMGVMAATMAHELNQPLSAAANYLTGARNFAERIEGDESDLVRTSIEASLSQIRRAGEIIRRVRGLIRSQPDPEVVACLNSIITDAVRSIRDSNIGAGIGFSCALEEHLGPVQADPVQTEQVVTNLLRNACEVVDRQPRREVRITTGRDGAFATVCVEDSGPGLARADPFEGLGVSDKGGLGIGLAISRTIVEAHGGRIWAQPSTGGGAAFLFTLPLAEADEGSEPGSDHPG